MNDNTKVVAALLAGLAAGAALGILFAPDKGSDTREKVNESLKDLGDAIKERTSEQANHVSALADSLIATIKSKLDKASDQVEEAIEEHA
ncbi:MAG TPA: YtxH domain-containing protein [Sphingobacteriaceae bacterium]|nr:YtxH domain-containing protein [Sphingobacteriaceae bacterium]